MDTRTHDGRFAPGVSGNPKGRSKGARNKATKMAEALLDGEARALARKAVDLALNENNVIALKLCLERILPRRERTVSFAMPPVKAPKDAATALAAIMQAIGSGDLTPSEAKQLASLIETSVRSHELIDHEKRLLALEEKQHG